MARPFVILKHENPLFFKGCIVKKHVPVKE